jgi:hypothetical protein
MSMLLGSEVKFMTQWYFFYGALKVKPLVICFPYVSYLL